jgi:murein L,D-transpeptidase YcbB/YkuD
MPLLLERVTLCVTCCVVAGCATSNSSSGTYNQSTDRSALQGTQVTQAESFELRSDPQPLLSAKTLRGLQVAEARYREIVASGGWPTIPSGPSFRPGDGDRRTSILARRLSVSGDLSKSNGGGLVSALQHFQLRHGLRVTGIADRQTIEALNIPASARLSQLRTNIARIGELSNAVQSAERYVVVNIPDFQLEAVENGRVARRHRVIVGRLDRQTPIVGASVKAVNFFPYWHVPESVARLDLIPRLRRDPEYLTRENIRVLRDWQGEELASESINWRSPTAANLKFRQDPGEWNALGLIRLDMPNQHWVYMHDTPMKKLFKQRWRAISAGCVRVENVDDLTAWVLRDVPGWGRANIDRVLASSQPVDVALKAPIPVRFVYLTAWVNGSGQVEFRFDLYGRDSTGGRVASMSGAGQESGGPRLSP